VTVNQVRRSVKTFSSSQRRGGATA